MKLLSVAFSTGGRRTLEGRLKAVVHAYAALVTCWVVYAATIALLDALALTIIFLALMLVLVFLTVNATPANASRPPPPYDYGFAAASAASGIYFALNAGTIAERITLLDPLTPWDITFGSVIWVLTLEATRRTVGLGLTALVGLFIVYNLWGDWFSGPLNHGVISYEHFLDIMVFTTDGIFGVPLRVAGTYVFLFVLFGTFLARAGGSDFFFDLAASLSGRSPGGPAKIAVVSSGLYGTISGSPTSDVVTTGAVTIPIMKRLGYSGALAGGVEVAASTGGSILPPVMGSAAFIMADFTDLDYIDIVIAGLVPAALFYICIYTQVHLRSLKMGLAPLAAEDVPPLSETLKRGGLFLVPLAIIIVALVKGYTPTYVAVFGALSVVGVSLFRADTRMGPRALYETLAEAALRMVPVTGACAAAGLVIGGITMTGLAAKFSHLIFFLTDADLFLSLVAAAMLTIVLGLGMPTPSAYILAAVLVGPLLINDLKVEPMAGHMFLLYFAVLSAMTPPVAVAAYAAAAIAEDNPMKIAVTAVRLALGAFVLPFAFVYANGILLIGSPADIAVACASAAAGLVLLSIAAEGYFKGPLAVWRRLLLAAAGLALLAPTMATGAVSVAAAVVALAPSFVGRGHGPDRAGPG